MVAARIGAAINVTSLFSPLVEQFNRETNATGIDALGFLIPSVEQLRWESIAEYREHPGSIEARSKLREFEQRALDQDPGDARDYLDNVKASITDDLMAALSETQVDLGSTAIEEALKAAVAFVPVVGSVIGPAIGLADALDRRDAQRHRWYFALMKLRHQ